MSNPRFFKFMLFATAASAAFALEPRASIITYSCYIIGRLIVNRLRKNDCIQNNARDLMHYALGGFIFGKFYTAFNWIYKDDMVNAILLSDSQLELLPNGMNYIFHLSLVSVFKSTFLLALPLFCVGFLNEELDGCAKNNEFNYMRVCRNLFISSSVRYFVGHGIEHNLFSRGAYFLGGVVGSFVFEVLDGGIDKAPLFNKESKMMNFHGLVVYKSLRDFCTSSLSTFATYLPFIGGFYCGYDITFSVLNKLSDQLIFSWFLDEAGKKSEIMTTENEK